ncbi:hypothetical protein [Streptomyces sp. NPDC006132]|uniref:hypothetical protein n=1 Tax=Streptomyces sp. NPDC006132 TaxID=3156732 RepID=UPI00340B4762
MPLPQFELSRPQYQLLAATVLMPLPDPAGADDARTEWLARGLDPGDDELDVSELVFLGLVARKDGSLTMTGLGAAVHYRAAHEAAEERLSSVARLAESAEDTHSQLARAVRRLAQGTISFEQALAEARREH